MHFFDCWWRHIISSPWTLQTSLHPYCYFLILSIVFTVQSRSNFLTLIWLYLLSSSIYYTKSHHYVPFSQFLDDFKISSHLYQLLLMNSLLPATSIVMSMILLTRMPFIQFLSLLDHANLTQRASFPTHLHSYIYSWSCHYICYSMLFPIVMSLPISPTDHFPFICSLKITNSPSVPITKYLTRANIVHVLSSK